MAKKLRLCGSLKIGPRVQVGGSDV